MLKNKIVVVTGGAGLLGREFLRAIAGAGAVAVNAERALALAEKATAELAAAQPTGQFAAVEMDITSSASVQRALADLEKKYGRIDALVNSAYPRNARYGAEFWDVTYEDFCENLNLHLGGYFLASQQFAKYFREKGGGNIVSVASIYGVVPPRFELYEGAGFTNEVEYAAIKSGLIHMTKYMAKCFAGMNIRVNCVSPGGIRAPGQPEVFLERYRKECLNKGMLDAKDVSGALLFLLSDDSKFVNGQNLVVDDGFTL
jgi:NAD(P)-dependent dehydrogenase (short-subunit alcohol dehydrogenase family)